jgi:glycosyltransferase involved in cell wall biosynthesis
MLHLSKTVCIIVQNHYDSDIRVRRKAEALVAAGYAVDVIALRSTQSPVTAYQLNGVNVYTISLGKKRGSLLRYLSEYTVFFAAAFWRLSVLMRTRRYGIVDVNNLPDFLVFAAAWAKLKGAKIVFDMHEITPEFYMSKYGIPEDSLHIRFIKFVERISMRFADRVITINEPITQLLSTRGLMRERSTVVMNSVDEAAFASYSRRPPPTDLPAEKPRFLMMYHGTLTKIYGLDIAIEAFGQAKEDMPGAEFWILGGGPEKDALVDLVRKSGLESKVRLIGSVLPDDIPQWLNCCDLGVLATRRDTFLDLSFSNKLSEYIIMRKAVICSRLRAIRHYFTEEALAYFEPNNPADLARQMVRLYGDPQSRARFASRATEEYMPIRWDVMKDRYLALIADLLVGKPNGQGKRPLEISPNLSNP